MPTCYCYVNIHVYLRIGFGDLTPRESDLNFVLFTRFIVYVIIGLSILNALFALLNHIFHHAWLSIEERSLAALTHDDMNTKHSVEVIMEPQTSSCTAGSQGHNEDEILPSMGESVTVI